MEFASKFVFNYSDSDEESVSDEEFQNGMCVSDSDSGEENELAGPVKFDSGEEIFEVPDPVKSDTLDSTAVVEGSSGGRGRLSKTLEGRKKKSGADMPQAARSVPESTPAPHREKGRLKEFFSRLSGGGEKKPTLVAPRPPPAKPKTHWRTEHYDDYMYEGRSHGSPSEGRKRYRRADTNVVSIRFEKLISPSHMHTGDPVYCGKCQAILSRISQLEDEGEGRVWVCEFCGEHNPVDVMDEEVPQIEDVTFMLEPAPATTASGPSGMDQSLVIFCVDVSGSMCVTTEVPGHVNLRGNQLESLQSWNTLHEDQHLPRERRNVTYISRLQAMQAAVDHQIQELARDFPHRRTALIAFNNEVEVLGDGTQGPVCISGDKLSNQEVLAKTGADIPTPKSVKESRAAISEKVFGLEEGGATALGPALTVAVAMASLCPGSKVIVCTDGMANVGLGSLENLNSEEDKEAAEDFYSGLGETALANSVSISVVSIKGSDCKLAQLGRVAELTGGQVNMVDPLKLTEEFSTILADRVIATNVVATFLLHKGLYLRNDEEGGSKAVKVVGNVSVDTEVTFEYGVRKEKKKKKKPMETSTPSTSAEGAEGGPSEAPPAESKTKVPKEYPFQLQIQYTDTEGTKALRVFTQNKPVTFERQVAEKDVNLEVLGTHTAQTSSRLALAGEYTKSRGLALMNQRLAWRHGQTDKSRKVAYRQYFGKIQAVENQVNQMQVNERSARGSTYSDDEADSDDDIDTVDAREKKAKRKKKKLVSRTATCSDSAATELYDMCHANPTKLLKK